MGKTVTSRYHVAEHLRTPEEMAAYFAQRPEALENTVKIADRCQVDFDFDTYHFPRFDTPPGQDEAVLEPGGLHIMFINLHHEVNEGDTVTVTNSGEPKKRPMVSAQNPEMARLAPAMAVRPSRSIRHVAIFFTLPAWMAASNLSQPGRSIDFPVALSRYHLTGSFCWAAHAFKSGN